MVNYCCVKGCGRSSKLSAHLNYFSLPKEKNRRYQWLAAAGRDDLIQNANPKKAYRICSRHFSIDCIKNRHLAPDTMPTLCLPDNNTDTSEVVVPHHDSVCDNCKNTIIGFRYKCVTCEDYDLCPKCEMLEYHSHHYMLRIPKPLKFKIADNLIQKWRSLFKVEHVKPDCDDDDTSGCSSDDEPISMHLARINDGGDLPDDVKAKIRGEVARVLAIKPDDKRKRKREKKNDSLLLKALTKNSNKKAKMDVDEAPKDVQVSGPEALAPVPEVAFADVNAYKDQMDIKNEVTAVAASEGDETVFGQPLMHVRLSDDLAELMIEMSSTGEKSVYKYN